MYKAIQVLFIALTLVTTVCEAQKEAHNIATNLMECTFRIDDPTTLKPVGTGFFVHKTFADTTDKRYIRVMITANHVLDSIKTDYATLVLRKRVNNNFIRVNYQIQIRENGKPLWNNPSKLDLALMFASVPPELDSESIFPLNLFITEEAAENIKLSPGEELFCLGFPGGIPSNAVGFPILRSGKIASYPVFPFSKNPDLLYSFEVLGGNSGGPVFYMSAMRINDNAVDYRGFQYLVGMVTNYLESKITKQELKIASVIPAVFILEAINNMQLPEEYRVKGK